MTATTSTPPAALRLDTPSLAEQANIAACLSSLDELIAAESRKLGALQAHKKGLMQQLFPRPGETVLGSKFFTGFGGKAANQAVMCAKLLPVEQRGKVKMLGKLGDDDHGDAYRGLLNRNDF